MFSVRLIPAHFHLIKRIMMAKYIHFNSCEKGMVSRHLNQLKTSEKSLAEDCFHGNINHFALFCNPLGNCVRWTYWGPSFSNVGLARARRRGITAEGLLHVTVELYAERASEKPKLFGISVQTAFRRLIAPDNRTPTSHGGVCSGG